MNQKDLRTLENTIILSRQNVFLGTKLQQIEDESTSLNEQTQAFGQKEDGTSPEGNVIVMTVSRDVVLATGCQLNAPHKWVWHHMGPWVTGHCFSIAAN